MIWKKKWNKIALPIVGLSMASSIIWACADDGLFTGANSVFTPELVQDSSYQPLFYDPYMPFYNIGFVRNVSEIFSNSVVQDWNQYLDGAVSRNTVSELLLKDTSSVTELKAFLSSGKLPKTWKSLTTNNAKAKSFATFLAYALQVDKVAAVDFEYWSYNDTLSKKLVSASLVGDLHKKFSSQEKGSFLQNRYWFQWLKSIFYSGNSNQFISSFDQTSKSQPKNELYYRALSYLAGVYKKQNKLAEANYYYSQVFDHCPSLRVIAAQDFYAANNTTYNATLQLAKTNEEKAAIWAIIGYYDDPIVAMKNIYSLEPSSPHLGYLLTRYINELEQKYNPELNYPFTNIYLQDEKDNTQPITTLSNRDSINQYLTKDDFKWFQSVANNAKVSEPGLWHLGIAYMSMLQGNAALASKELLKAKEVGSNNSLYQTEIRLFSLVNNVFNLKTINNGIEKDLQNELDWFVNKMGKNNDYSRYSYSTNYNSSFTRYDYAYAKIRQRLSQLYKENGQLVKAELVFPNGSFYLNNENAEQMKSFMKQNSNDAYDKIWIESYLYKWDDIVGSQAILQTMRGDLSSAVNYAHQITESDTSKLYANPFNGYIFDNHDWEFSQPQKIKYTVKSFIEKMDFIQKERDNQNSYTDAVLLANAFYNITYYGNSRCFSGSNSIIQNIYGYSRSESKDYDINLYYNMALTEKAYRKALEFAPNKEQKAKMTYFLAKCQRNTYYTSAFFLNASWNSWEEHTSAMVKDWDAFKVLRADYKDTKYYQEVIKECGYFKP